MPLKHVFKILDYENCRSVRWRTVAVASDSDVGLRLLLRICLVIVVGERSYGNARQSSARNNSDDEMRQTVFEHEMSACPGTRLRNAQMPR